jgi:hypothetical protein
MQRTLPQLARHFAFVKASHLLLLTELERGPPGMRHPSSFSIFPSGHAQEALAVSCGRPFRQNLKEWSERQPKMKLFVISGSSLVQSVCLPSDMSAKRQRKSIHHIVGALRRYLIGCLPMMGRSHPTGPNPSFHRTLRIKPRQAAEFRRYPSSPLVLDAAPIGLAGRGADGLAGQQFVQALAHVVGGFFDVGGAG